MTFTAEETRTLRIEDCEISDSSDCYVIAEIGHNHQGSVEKAKEMFDVAKDCGAHAVKLQKRDNRSLFTREFFNKPYENENSFGADLRRAPRGARVRRARVRGADRLRGGDRHHVLRHRVRHAERRLPGRARHARLQDRLRRPDQPPAAAPRRGDRQADDHLHRRRDAGRRAARATRRWPRSTPSVAILQCTAGYPAAWEELDLRVIETYRELFPEAVVGLSSHDNGIAMPVGGLHARRPHHREALHARPRDARHRPQLLARAAGLREDGPRPASARASRWATAIKKMYPSEVRAGRRRWARSSSPPRDLPAGHMLAPRTSPPSRPATACRPTRSTAWWAARCATRSSRDTALSFEMLEEPCRRLACSSRSRGAGCG